MNSEKEVVMVLCRYWWKEYSWHEGVSD